MLFQIWPTTYEKGQVQKSQNNNPEGLNTGRSQIDQDEGEQQTTDAEDRVVNPTSRAWFEFFKHLFYRAQMVLLEADEKDNCCWKATEVDQKHGHSSGISET
jgi:hypothetical protein